MAVGRRVAERSGLLMYEELVLTDLRDAGAEVDLVPCGALSPRLIEPTAPNARRRRAAGPAGASRGARGAAE